MLYVVGKKLGHADTPLGIARHSPNDPGFRREGKEVGNGAPESWRARALGVADERDYTHES